MWSFVHISTLKKHWEHQSPFAATPREFQCVKRKNRFALRKKSYLQKNYSVRKKSTSGRPFACQTATAFPALMSILYRPHVYKRDISLLAPADFHASSRFFLPRFPWFPVCITNFRAFLIFVAGAACIGNRLYLQRFIFCARSAACDRICALFSTLTANLSLFTAFLRAKANSLRSLLRLFQLILIDVSRETRIFLAIFSIIRAVHYSSLT